MILCVCEVIWLLSSGLMLCLCVKYHLTLCPELWFLSQCSSLKQPVFSCTSFGVSITGATAVLMVAVVAGVVVVFIDDVVVDGVVPTD